MLGASHVAKNQECVAVDKEHCLGAVSLASGLFFLLRFVGYLDTAVRLRVDFGAAVFNKKSRCDLLSFVLKEHFIFDRWQSSIWSCLIFP